MMLDDTDEFCRVKFENGQRARYIGCQGNCDCQSLPPDLKAILESELLPGKMHMGREGTVQMCGNAICKIEIAIGASLISHVDHFEAVNVG